MSESVAKILRDRQRRAGQRDGESTGQFLWRALRESIRKTTREVARADAAEIHIGHGVHHLRKINHTEPVLDVMYNKETEEYLTIDCHGINLFHKDGRAKDQLEPEEPIEKLVFAPEVKRYVGWSTGEEYLKMFTEDFDLISEAKAPHKICCALYNDQQNEVVTAGQASIMSWCFRYGAKHLIPKKSIDPTGLTPDDVFTMIALETTASRAQRCFAVHDAGVAVFNLYEGTLLSYKKNLHVRSITSMLFFNPLKQLITGARDGSIKVWDDTWHLLLVFVGHSAAVTALGVYPYGPYIVSASQDCSLRVWSLETCDEVDMIETDEPVEGLGTVLRKDNIFSHSKTTVDLWRLRHIHNLFTAVGSKVTKITTTDHPNMPTRAVCLCRDSSVRIITPGSGDVLTSFLASTKQGILDAAYAAADNILFVVCKTGDIIKADTSKNPAKVLRVWKHESHNEKDYLNTIALYEYVIEPTQTPESRWSKSKSRNRTLLIGGRRDGNVAVLHWNTMEVVFKADAHGFKGVLGLKASPKNDLLISTGLDYGMLFNDNVIKVWRVFPFAEESLAPLMSFYCAHTPLHMSVMRATLCVAFQDESSATYSIVHYNLKNKERNDHSPDQDHIDSITGIACNPRMGVFASSSTDGTIKIWDEDNTLIRSIKLNAEALSLNFYSQKGDLLVGIGNHIHRIDHASYMPRMYLRKMVSMVFPDVPTETPIPLDEDKVRAMSPLSNKRLKAAHSSVFKFEHFKDVLTEEETEELTREKKLKEAAFTVLDARETELRKLRDGTFDEQPKKKAAVSAAKIKKAAFRRYWNLVHLETEHEKIPDEDNFNPDAGDEDEESEASWKPEREPSGFFPHPSTVRRPPKPQDLPGIFETQLREEDYEDGIRATVERVEVRKPAPQPPLALPINPSGFIPNSVLIRLLWPPEETEKMKEKYKPPSLSDDQLAQIAVRRRPKSLESPEELPIPSPEPTPDKEKTPILTPEPEDTGTPKASLLDKFNIDIAPMPKDIPDQEPTPSPPHTPTPEPKPETPKETPKPPPRPKVQKLPKPVVKVVTPKPATPSPPPPPTPSPPRPPTPLPSFISQFKGAEWFEEYFPNATNKTFPKPWTVTAFVTMLLRLLKIADYAMKTPILEAIIMLYQQDSLANTKVVIDTVMGVLNKSSPPTCQDEDQKGFILMSLKALQAMTNPDTEMVVELIVQFLDGDKEVRELVHDIFLVLGLQDMHNYFFKELDSWDVWSVDEENRKKELNAMARRWLDKWLTLFKSHLRKTIEQLKKGKVAGNIQRRQATRATPPSESPSKGKGILKTKSEQGDGSKPTSSKSETRSEFSHVSTGSPVTESFMQSQQLTVTFDMPPDLSTIENAQPMEGINYFVEMELERYMEKMRLAAAREQASKEVSEDRKNTVLVLPKIRSGSAQSLVGRESSDEGDLDSSFFLDSKISLSGEHKTPSELWDELQRMKKKRRTPERVRKSKPSLVRLGETHTSHCRPHRETTYEADLRLPPIASARRFDVDGLYNFTTKIDLPMKTLYMNPFPSPIDAYEQLHQPILLTLKSAQKYFIPGQSFVREENFR
ncbi:WD repeat-containing protein 97-like isoform X3 [Patiria miniata]|uniref:WD repeat-containing protein 97 n=1 Tax=Patiria miniata TaxID=46514 RepID=A0A914BN96_PATMI|nr:WD repeat-containing protein 97-like isoform X3 [Patiria miniata]